jgi:poly[(R)-3-hydroxyalkanoate] polymerase subunit PhaC
VTATPDRRAKTGPRAASRAALDVMLTDAAVESGGSRRFLQPNAAVKTVDGLARHPGQAVRRVRGLGSELARVVVGRSEVVAAKGDRRFGDRGWQENWLLHRLMQSFLALEDTVEGLITDADLDWHAERKARFAAENVLDALAPTNYPWSNPAVIKEIVDTGGANLVRGTRRFLRDISRPPHLPATVDTSRFDVGGNLAVSPGSVVLGTEVFELIQYQPQTKQVREVPLLFVPPTINKYYVLDLAPGRSMVEHLVAQGQQVFMISWRNPDAAQGHFDFDTYAQAVLEARAAVAAISAQKTVHLNAACSGGIITAGALGHLAATGALSQAASLTLLVCALDNARAGTTAALATREASAVAVAQSARKGYLDGRALASVFAWLRPNDLIWGYVVNNYLLGKPPPAFDILYWNQDTVRLAAGLHRDFIAIALDNSITRAGGLTVLGTPVDLGAVDVDSYVVAGANDHIVPWENAYRSTQLLRGEARFILATSGHIQTLINPPSPDSRSSYRVAEGNPADSETWFAQASKRPGSWWPDYNEWLQARSGELKPAPRTLGNRRYRALAKAPGSYIHAG